MKIDKEMAILDFPLLNNVFIIRDKLDFDGAKVIASTFGVKGKLNETQLTYYLIKVAILSTYGAL